MDLISRNINKVPPKKQRKVKLHACEYDDCEYITKKAFNLKRHVSETHKGEKKMCICGKQYTVSALSRHKQDCSVNLNHQSAATMNQTVDCEDIPSSEILNVQEHTMKIKVITKTDGSVFLVYNNFTLGNTSYRLQPMNDFQSTEAKSPTIKCNGK